MHAASATAEKQKWWILNPEPHIVENFFPNSRLLYFGNNNLLLSQFRPGGNDSKNRSECFSENKKILRFWYTFQLPYRSTVLLKSNCFKGCFNQATFYNFQFSCQGNVLVKQFLAAQSLTLK